MITDLMAVESTDVVLVLGSLPHVHREFIVRDIVGAPHGPLLRLIGLGLLPVTVLVLVIKTGAVITGRVRQRRHPTRHGSSPAADRT